MKDEEHDAESDVSFESTFYENFANGQELNDRASITKANCKAFVNQKLAISSYLSKIHVNPAAVYAKKIQVCKILINEADKYKNLFEILNTGIEATKAQIEGLETTARESEVLVEKYTEDIKKLTNEVKSQGRALSVATEKYAENFDVTIDVRIECENLYKASVYFGLNKEIPFILHIDPIQRKIVDLDGSGVLSDNEKEELRQKTNNFQYSAYLGVLLWDIIKLKSQKRVQCVEDVKTV